MATSTTLTPELQHDFLIGFAEQQYVNDQTINKPKMPQIDYEKFRDDDENDKDGQDYYPPPPVNFGN